MRRQFLVTISRCDRNEELHRTRCCIKTIRSAGNVFDTVNMSLRSGISNCTHSWPFFSKAVTVSSTARLLAGDAFANLSERPIVTLLYDLTHDRIQRYLIYSSQSATLKVVGLHDMVPGQLCGCDLELRRRFCKTIRCPQQNFKNVAFINMRRGDARCTVPTHWSKHSVKRLESWVWT